MKIPVNLDSQSYDIILERGVLSRVSDEIDLDRKVLIVTDDGVPPEYAKTVAERCKDSTIVTIPMGEESKNFDEFKHLLSVMLNASFSRKDCVVAVGGGVVGDLSAFSASCYMRGIDFYNIPTTLLSQVDSSVGGKTAIDFEGVKNIVGSFYQPKKVIIDTDTLKTLDKRQIHAGLAEAIKMAANFDAELFEKIENSTDLDKDLEEIIKGALCIKRDVVEKDPKESGLRRVLNFGHTVGHAIESASEGVLLHGECVAMGMLPFCSEAVRPRLINVLKKYDLPVDTEKSSDELMPYLIHDKKKQRDVITVVCCDEIGTFRFEDMKPEKIMELVERTR